MTTTNKCAERCPNHEGLCLFNQYGIGYTYTVAWGVSFLGQIWLNYKLKNVQGCNLDFVAYNLTGFTFYAIYNIAGFAWSGSGIGGVEVNDLVFAVWAWTMSLITFIQCFFIYPRYNNQISRVCIIMTCVYWFIAVLYTMLTEIDGGAFTPPQMLNIFYVLSYMKLFISLTKYIPQAWWNYKRQSTSGWSIFNILLDLTGGVFSLLQIIINIAIKYDNPFKSQQGQGLNIAKFGLSIISILFDVLFIIQHYVLYNPKKRKADGLIFDPAQISMAVPVHAEGVITAYSTDQFVKSQDQTNNNDEHSNKHYQY